MKNVADSIAESYSESDGKYQEIALKGHTKGINCLGFDEFNKVIYSASKDGSIIKCKEAILY